MTDATTVWAAKVYARRGERARIAEYSTDEGDSAIRAIEVAP